MTTARNETLDYELLHFATQGAPTLRVANEEGYVERAGARIWYASHGSGPPVLLLHGGLGHSGNWGYQLPTLLNSGRSVILIDSRGHGRSTRDDQPYSYELMADDAFAVLERLSIPSAAVIGWSDGACTGLAMAGKNQSRVERLFFFACNVDASGTKELSWPNPILERCLSRHIEDYKRLSATPNDFEAFSKALEQMMRTQPNYSADQLANLDVHAWIALGEHDEFIKREHAEYIATHIPRARFVLLPRLSHFAPLQDPASFSHVLTDFLEEAYTRR
jgi:pimeloyl-ACP methyl ester carboxylesterase